MGIQEAAFLKSSAIARDWQCLVFVCLRPSTFFHSKQKGILDSIAPKVFAVGHPDISLVLKRRFTYAKELAAGSKKVTAWDNVAPSKDISFDLPRVAKLLECCEFAARKRHGIIPMLEAVSNGNIRVLLDQTKSILTAGHLNTKKILAQIEKGNAYVIPDFEGVKTLLYGDYMHYDPSKSVFINLFDLLHLDPNEHFLRFAAVCYLNRFSVSDATRGYVRLSDLRAYLATLGFCFDDISRSLEYLFDQKCIRAKIDGMNWSDPIEEVRVTYLGRYHINNLVNFFQYMDAIILDTPILDVVLRDSLTEGATIGERLTRTSVFIDYLDKCSQGLSDSILIEEWAFVKKSVKQDIAEIADRNRLSGQEDAHTK